MGVLSLVSSIPCGICRGAERAQLGAWARWGRKKQNALVRVTAKFSGGSYHPEPEPATWSFLPIHPEECWYSLDLPSDMRDALVSQHRSTRGVFEFQFHLLDGTVHQLEYGIDEILWFYRGEGDKAPSELLLLKKDVRADDATIAALDLEGLKTQSDQILAERKAAAEKAEAEKKAAEAAAAAAKKAAAAAKAPAAASGGSATAADPSPKAKIGLVYGSSTGNTAMIADMIREAFGTDGFLVKNVTEITPAVFNNFENIILGVPTWHIGEMQDDWAAFLPLLDAGKLDFKGRKLAIFGLGDGKGYPDTYVDAMEELWRKFKPSGITLVGHWPTEGYPFQKSKAIENGKFLGLVIDIENQAEMNQARVNGWVAQLKGQLG